LAKIWVFANGIPGSGVMGFQPAVFDSQAQTSPVWSPLWNHFTLKWKDGQTPRVLKSQDDVLAALKAGEVEQFNGTPDTHPNGFIVNCPAPVLAPNAFTGGFLTAGDYSQVLQARVLAGRPRGRGRGAAKM
jgi:hypothetical protein